MANATSEVQKGESTLIKARSLMVFGASGLLGSHLIALAKESGINTISVTRAKNLPSSSSYIYEDLERPSPELSWDGAIDAVVYLAQSENFRDFPSKALSVFKVNLDGLMRALDFAAQKKVRAFVYASSGGVYQPSHQPLSEDSPLQADEKLGFYAATKRAGELLVLNYSSQFTTVVLRYFFIYGHGQRSSMLIPRLVSSVKQGLPIQIEGNGGLRINPIEATDAAKATLRATDCTRAEVINVGGPETYNLKQIGETIGTRLQKRPAFSVKNGVPKDLFCDIKKQCSLLGAPEVSFEKGLERYLESLR